uniref:Queuosine 5'-phosphate N-glycosylase/hydrolase n=1 Tax=Chlamydomonas leiostraca TaxID=1034604 RepID=A0A7S0S2W2_9CHLO|mmetsp:Transcript_5446/g.13442  ORF Transcript_5446/g.13442 Transcript_5446/m.13442 type:complete len:357 (+) Transcript_5446:91-1161(+)|eukprot:CAMPEP_0202869258 /NCGR_PEP_ID=MMETSP1391-20130828/12286_1 /ASSEMBLY_ACC=CAM_ASM_000867 /TAXON_ID=1034604 /ORGANISM="Chlamydomonas leiostraca, Strain SAG 11-49" /LENGTH=356 /DNA_ID=CAMNT_0049549555 /DNA_START=83 /DNA_END=1153 /DNA_ORIENTATION=+
MPGAAQPSILEIVRSSCKRVTDLHQEHIKIDSEAVFRIAAELDPAQVKNLAASAGGRFPIKFESQQAEINFLAVYHLLRFGSGYDNDLKARAKRDVAEAVQFGVLGMHLSATRLDGPWMRSFNAYSVHNFFGVESHEERPVPNLPGVTMSSPGPLHPLATSLASAVSDAGHALDELGHKSFGEMILSVVSDLHTRQHPAPAAALVSELVESFPGFQDSALYDGATVTFARKAQALVAALAARFGSEDPRFAFADVSALTADSGPLVAAALRAKGAVVVQGELAHTLDEGEELPSGPHERALRAAAVTACEEIVTAAGGPGVFSAHELSLYLGQLGEEGQELRGQLKPHLTKGTQAY